MDSSDHAAVVFAQQLRKLMRGPPDPEPQLQAIQEIVNARIDALRAKHPTNQHTTNGTNGGSQPEP